MGTYVAVPRDLLRRLRDQVDHHVDHHKNSVVADLVKQADGFLDGKKRDGLYPPFIGGKEMPTHEHSPTGCTPMWLYESSHVPNAVYIEAHGSHIEPEVLVEELRGYIAWRDGKEAP